jgi:hypothetical protein
LLLGDRRAKPPDGDHSGDQEKNGEVIPTLFGKIAFDFV